MDGAPVVGLTTYREVAAWGVWNARTDLLPTEYAASVEAAGGVPLLLPPVATPGAAARVVSRIDGHSLTESLASISVANRDLRMGFLELRPTRPTRA